MAFAKPDKSLPSIKKPINQCKSSVFLSSIFLKLKRIETILKAKFENIVQKHILKRGLEKNLDDFLNIVQKLLNKKKWLINAFN